MQINFSTQKVSDVAYNKKKLNPHFGWVVNESSLSSVVKDTAQNVKATQALLFQDTFEPLREKIEAMSIKGLHKELELSFDIINTRYPTRGNQSTMFPRVSTKTKDGIFSERLEEGIENYDNSFGEKAANGFTKLADKLSKRLAKKSVSTSEKSSA